jgi:carbon monoxide dehydrogenase subunit G
MQLNGVLRINVGGDALRAALARPEVLAELLPGKAEVTQTSPGQYDFTLTRSMGFFDFTQKGQITLQAETPERERLTIKASNLLGGSVALSVALDLTPVPAGTRIAYAADLQAKGLAGRLLADREEHIQPYVMRVFQKLKAQIERQA